jgi:mercuric ion transport protein
MPGSVARDRAAGATAGAALAGGLAMIACCIAPLALFLLGVGGTWIVALTGLGAYKGWIATGTLGLLGLGLYLSYRRPRACLPGTACETGRPRRLVRGALWVGSALAAMSLAFQLIAPYVLGA